MKSEITPPSVWVGSLASPEQSQQKVRGHGGHWPHDPFHLQTVEATTPVAIAVTYSKVNKQASNATAHALCIHVNWIYWWCKAVGSPVISAAGAGGTVGDSHCKTGSGHQFSSKYTKKVTVFPQLCFPRIAHGVTAEMFTRAISGGSAGLHCIAVYIKHC